MHIEELEGVEVLEGVEEGGSRFVGGYDAKRVLVGAYSNLPFRNPDSILSPAKTRSAKLAGM